MVAKLIYADPLPPCFHPVYVKHQDIGLLIKAEPSVLEVSGLELVAALVLLCRLC